MVGLVIGCVDDASAGGVAGRRAAARHRRRRRAVGAAAAWRPPASPCSARCASRGSGVVAVAACARGRSQGRAGERRPPDRQPARGSLVVQLAVSLALVAAGGLFVRAATARRAPIPGSPRGRARRRARSRASPATTRRACARRTARCSTRVRSMPGVERVSFASTVPFGSMTEGQTVRLKDADKGVHAIFVVVGSSYFDTLGMPMLRGREFTARRRRAGPGSTDRDRSIDRLARACSATRIRSGGRSGCRRATGDRSAVLDRRRRRARDAARPVRGRAGAARVRAVRRPVQTRS